MDWDTQHLKIALDHLVGSFVETSRTLWWEKAAKKVNKRKKGRVLSILQLLLLRLLLIFENISFFASGRRSGESSIGHTFILENHHSGDYVPAS